MEWVGAGLRCVFLSYIFSMYADITHVLDSNGVSISPFNVHVSLIRSLLFICYESDGVGRPQTVAVANLCLKAPSETLHK